MNKHNIERKTGATMIELILVGALVSAASVFVLSSHLSKDNYRIGETVASKSSFVLEDAFKVHPVNSMITPITLGLDSTQLAKKKEEVERVGFSNIGLEQIQPMIDRHFSSGVTEQKAPITLAPEFQFFRFSTELTGTDTCSGFIAGIRDSQWHTVEVNTSLLLIPNAQVTDLSNLCSAGENSSFQEYDVTLTFCYETPALPCIN